MVELLKGPVIVGTFAALSNSHWAASLGWHWQYMGGPIMLRIQQKSSWCL